MSERARFAKTVLFVPPGVDPEEVSDEMILPGSNIVLGPYAGHSQIKCSSLRVAVGLRIVPKMIDPSF
ncbi:hypothetical protein CRYUN_Cryun22dG0085600 [Craigia yunnanensis]